MLSGARRAWQSQGPAFARLLLSDALMLLFPLKRLLQELEGFLRGRGAGVQHWQLKLEHMSRRSSTIDLRVDYLRPGKPLTLVAEAQVVRQGNRVGVADVRLFHPEHPDATIATGKGVYNIKLVREAKA